MRCCPHCIEQQDVPAKWFLSGIKSVWGMPQVSDPGAVDGMAIQFLDVLVEPGLEVFAVLQQMADRAVP